MAIFNVGSINADLVYRVPRLPARGETLAATARITGLGGKGANQSIAAARAGSDVRHIGAVGPDGAWAVEMLASSGVEVSGIARSSEPTGHAIITVDDTGENAIVVLAGANATLQLSEVEAALASAGTGDYLLLQNETSLQAEAAGIGRARGMFVVYSAAPFDADRVDEVLPYLDLLVLNQIEADQLAAHRGRDLTDLEIPNVLITRGAEGAYWRAPDGSRTVVPAHRVAVADTTGAGDCFIGYVLAGLDQGLSPESAMQLGAAASALQVSRAGAADAIPTRAEVETFLAARAGTV